MMAVPMPMVASTSSGPMAFGRMCRHDDRLRSWPRTVDASMKPEPLTWSVVMRTIRA